MADDLPSGGRRAYSPCGRRALMSQEIDTIGFIGLGAMGGPMCHNLARKAGVPVLAFDLAPARVGSAVDALAADRDHDHGLFGVVGAHEHVAGEAAVVVGVEAHDDRGGVAGGELELGRRDGVDAGLAEGRILDRDRADP